jgi:transcriptional regulator with PAS, ATPase and Fis domain
MSKDMAPSSDKPDEPRADPGRVGFRWPSYFQHAAEPLFVLSRRRRLLFANRAWEECTGLSFAAVRGWACRRSYGEIGAEREILAVLAPPPEALAGEVCRVRRRLPGAGPIWWEISYFPFLGKEGLLAILGRLRALSGLGTAAFTLPERWMTLRDRQAARYQLDDLGSTSAALQRVREQARLALQVRLPVLLAGAAGVGKEWLARALHQLGPQRQHFFARIDCARLPPAAVVDVLFGPRSPLLALGTVYLREPASLPRDAQDRLARLLAEQESVETETRPRLLFGMRGDPQEAVRAGRLLEELYCRASTLTITLPPLRERLEELPRLVEVFLRRASEAMDCTRSRVSTEALQVLRGHAWPGNLRELYTVLLGACRHARGEQVELADLPFYLRHGPLPAEQRMPLDELLERAEQRLIEVALRLTRDNKTRAAELLAIWRPRLDRRLKHFGLLDATEPGETEGQ